MSIWCYRRKTYASEQAAMSAVYSLRAKGSDVSAYRCDACGKWHIRALPLIGRGQTA